MGSTPRTRFGHLNFGAKVGVGMAVAAGTAGTRWSSPPRRNRR